MTFMLCVFVVAVLQTWIISAEVSYVLSFLLPRHQNGRNLSLCQKRKHIPNPSLCETDLKGMVKVQINKFHLNNYALSPDDKRCYMCPVLLLCQLLFCQGLRANVDTGYRWYIFARCLVRQHKKIFQFSI